MYIKDTREYKQIPNNTKRLKKELKTIDLKCAPKYVMSATDFL